MWVFTEIGFFSAVATPDDTNTIMVRGRVRNDLERLKEALGNLGQEVPEILQWENRDYPYRVLLPRQSWSKLMEQLADGICYSNFKSQVAATDGSKRASLYGRIWDIMLGAERKLGLPRSNRSSYE